MMALAFTALLQHCHRARPAQYQLSVPGLWTSKPDTAVLKKFFFIHILYIENIDNTVKRKWDRWVTLNFKT